MAIAHEQPEAATSSRVALLGTLGHLHAEAVGYDLGRLRELVEVLEPDLLGVEVEPEDWERGQVGSAPLDVREALLPAARRTNTVIVPLAGCSALELAPPECGPLAGLRAKVSRAADRLLERLQRGADGPGAVNSSFFTHVCGLLCEVEEAAAGEPGRRAWKDTNERILARLLQAVRWDPGRRVLVAVQCRRVHWLERRLRPMADEIALVPYQAL